MYLTITIKGSYIFKDIIGTFRTRLTLEINEPHKPKGGLSKQSNDANS
jgi:hypothetical protein